MGIHDYQQNAVQTEIGVIHWDMMNAVDMIL